MCFLLTGLTRIPITQLRVIGNRKCIWPRRICLNPDGDDVLLAAVADRMRADTDLMRGVDVNLRAEFR